MISVVNSRSPPYGNQIDLLLDKDVKTRIEAGLPIDDAIFRMVLVDNLESHGKVALMIENGGKLTFNHGWAHRFWKRHNLVSLWPNSGLSGGSDGTGRVGKGKAAGVLVLLLKRCG